MANYELFNQPQQSLTDNSRLAFGVPGQTGCNNILISNFRKENRAYRFNVNEVNTDDKSNIQLVGECTYGTVVEVIEILGTCTVSVRIGANNYLIQNYANTGYTKIELNYYHSITATESIYITCSSGSGKVAISYIKGLLIQ